MLFKLNHYLVEAYLNAEGGDWGGGGGVHPQKIVKDCGTREA